MTFAEWLNKREIKAYIFARENQLPMTVMYKLKRGGKVSYETAEKVSAATGGELSIMEIYRPGT
jgi:predicted transcriptional regulator